MSLDSDYHDLVEELFNEFEASRGDVVRRVDGVDTPASRAAGILPIGGTEELTVSLFLGKAKVSSEDGISSTVSVAISMNELIEGDKLTVNDLKFTIGPVEKKNPYGTIPLIWIAALR